MTSTLESRVENLEKRLDVVEKNMNWFMAQFHLITGESPSESYQTMIPGFRAFMYNAVEGKEFLSTLVYKQIYANRIVNINDGWWKFSELDWLSKVGITGYKVRNYEEWLCPLGILEISRKNKVKCYRVSIDTLIRVLTQFYNHPELKNYVENIDTAESKQEYIIKSEFYTLFAQETNPEKPIEEVKKPKQKQKEVKEKLKYIDIFYEVMRIELPKHFSLSVQLQPFLTSINYPGGNKNYVTINSEKKLDTALKKLYPAKSTAELYTVYKQCIEVWLRHEFFQWEKINKAEVKADFSVFVNNIGKIVPKLNTTQAIKPVIKF